MIAPDVIANLIVLAAIAGTILAAGYALQRREDAEEAEASHLPDAAMRRSIRSDNLRNLHDARFRKPR